jgi:mono/diheme cytochrome c family protein
VRRALVLLVGCAVLAGCGAGKTVEPVPETVIGTAPKAAVGNAAAGKALFASNGCASCHTYGPAGATGKVGPDLDKLKEYAQQANQGAEPDFVKTSIVDPNAYVQPGFPKGTMPAFSSLNAQQLADLVAFLTQSS